MMEQPSQRQQKGCLSPGIPPGALPRWAKLPLDRKLPMVPHPGGAVQLCTTKIGQKLYDTCPEMDFDLTDPYSMLMSNNYKPLHDPHLSLHLNAHEMRSRLHKGGFITKDGKVLCTLQEFNEYRQYLRKIDLAIEHNRMRLEKAYGSKKSKSKRRPSMASMLARQREEKVKEVKERLREQYEADRARYQYILKKDEDRCIKIRNDLQNKISAKESRFRELQSKRMERLQRKFEEDQQRKRSLVQKWSHDDARRSFLAAERRRHSNKERQKSLKLKWEERVSYQMSFLHAEAQRQAQEESAKQERIKRRMQLVSKRKNKQQETLLQLSQKRRWEKEQKEREYAERFQQRMLEKAAAKAQDKAQQRLKKLKGGARYYQLQSSWDVRKSLLTSMGLPEEGDTGREMGDEETMDIVAEAGDSSMSVASSNFSSFCGGSSFLGTWSSRSTLSAGSTGSSWAYRSDISEQSGVMQVYSEQELRTMAIVDLISNMKADQEEDYAYIPSCEEVASAVVGLNNYIATQVMYPAMQRVRAEEEAEALRMRAQEARDDADQTVYQVDLQRPCTPLPRDQVNSLEIISYSELSDYTGQDVNNSKVYLAKRGSKSVKFESENNIVIEFDDTPGLRISQESLFADDDDISEGEEADNEDDESTDDLLCVSTAAGRRLSLRTEGNDSLTNLRRTSLVMTPQNTELSLLLHKILAIVEQGNINNDQEQALLRIVREILGIAESITESSESTTTAMKSFASTFVTGVVKDCMERVKKELFPESSTAIVYPDVPEHKMEELTRLLVQQTLDNAISCLLKINDEAGEAGGSDVDELPPSASQTGLDDKATDGSDSSSGITGVSTFIGVVIEKVLGELRSSADIVPVKAELRSSSTYSVTDTMLKEILTKVMIDLQADLSKLVVQQKKSATSELVLNTLEKVMQDIKLENKPSSTTDFLAGVLDKAVSDVGRSQAATPACAQPLEAADSDASVLSLLIHETLDRVTEALAGEIKTDQEKQAAKESATDCFVGQVIRETLSKCVKDLREGAMSPKAMKNMVVSIVSTHNNIESNRSHEPVVKGYASDTLAVNIDLQKANSSALLEALIKETLGEVMASLRNGAMSDEQIKDMAIAISSIGSVAQSKHEEPVQPIAISSSDAVLVVEKALNDVLASLNETPIEPTPPVRKTSSQGSSIDSDEVMNMVQMIIGKTYMDLAGNTGIDFDEDDSDEDDLNDEPLPGVKLEPTLGDKPLDVDPNVMNETLLAISAKDPKKSMPGHATERNSFMSLTRPDVSSVASLDTSDSSKGSMEKQLVALSSKSLALSRSKVKMAVEMSEETPASDSGHEPTIKEESAESEDDEDDGEVLNIIEAQELDMKEPEKEQPKPTEKPREIAAKSSGSLTKKSSKTSPYQSPKTSSTSAKSLSSTKSLSPRKSSTKSIKPSPKTSPTKKKSGKSTTSVKSRQSFPRGLSTLSQSNVLPDTAEAELMARSSRPLVPTSVPELSVRRSVGEAEPELKEPQQLASLCGSHSTTRQKHVSEAKSDGAVTDNQTTKGPETCDGEEAEIEEDLPKKVHRMPSKSKKSQSRIEAMPYRDLSFTTSSSRGKVKQDVSDSNQSQASDKKSKSSLAHRGADLTPRPSSAFSNNPVVARIKAEERKSTSSTAAKVKSSRSSSSSGSSPRASGSGADQPCTRSDSDSSNLSQPEQTQVPEATGSEIPLDVKNAASHLSEEKTSNTSIKSSTQTL